MLALVLLLVLVQPAAETPDATQPIESPACEHAGCPQAVCNLFYAVKDSLDYGIDKHPRPAQRIEDHKRVTSELLERLNREFQILEYRPVGMNYELVVVRRSDPSEKYRATRDAKFRWVDGKWVSLGGYLYF